MADGGRSNAPKVPPVMANRHAEFRRMRWLNHLRQGDALKEFNVYRGG